jgi:hypothetical protein
MKTITKRYAEPVPAKWRKIGDTALLLAIAVEPMVSTIPLQNPAIKEWVVWIFSTALIVFKFWTNTKSIHDEAN